MTSWRRLAAALAALMAAGLTGCSPSAAPATRAPAPAAAGRPAAGTAAMEEYLAGLASAGRFSGTVLVDRDGRVLLNAGYGLADRATGVRNGPQTIFQVGSVTKQFTAMAIAILAARGRLALAGRACAYLPRCPPAWGPITIAELLTHTSGIANWSSWPTNGP